MNYFKGLQKIPSFDGKYKVLFRQQGKRTIEQLESFEDFLAGESAKAGGRLFMFFEPEANYEYDSKGNIKRNKKGEPIIRGSSEAKDAARAMAKMAKQHGLDARVNSSGLLVFANPNKTIVKRSVINLGAVKEKRPLRKGIPKVLKARIKQMKRGDKQKNNTNLTKTEPKKGLLSRLFG